MIVNLIYHFGFSQGAKLAKAMSFLFTIQRRQKADFPLRCRAFKGWRTGIVGLTSCLLPEGWEAGGGVHGDKGQSSCIAIGLHHGCCWGQIWVSSGLSGAAEAWDMDAEWQGHLEEWASPRLSSFLSYDEEIESAQSATSGSVD